MEQHPVPRNITGFQFRLIGDMTLRQFGYLAGGIFIGYIVYRISILPPIITFPIAGTFALLGVAFAFLPIQERPLDRWVVAFIRSIFSPTQYVWEKVPVIPNVLTLPSPTHVQQLPTTHAEAHKDAKEKLHAYLRTLPNQPHHTLNMKEQSYINSTLALFNTPNAPAYARPVPTIPTHHVSQPVSHIPTTTMAQQSPGSMPIKPPPEKNVEVKPPMADSPLPTPTPPPEPMIDLKKQLEDLAKQKEELMKNLSNLEEQLQTIKQQPSPTPEATPKPLSTLMPTEQKIPTQEVPPAKEVPIQKTPPISPTPEVKTPSPSELQTQQPTTKQSTPPSKQSSKEEIKVVPAQAAKTEVGIPSIPQTPNVIIGIIKDAQKRLLPNIIITIKDKNSMPIRALKTNKLGQFATATPLPNGSYLIEAEDPLKRYTFDIVNVSLEGKIFQPIEITAKGEKEIIREQLSKELFGNI